MLKKLLLADDSLTIQKVVGIVFANLDYQLLIADNGDDALALARKEFPDLVIADIGMPGRDGFELCREIKNDANLSSTPVLLLPGAFENFDESKAAAVGADGWLTKPFESQALINKVEALLAAASESVTVAAVPEPSFVEESVSFEDPEPISVEENISFEIPEPKVIEEPAVAGEDIWDAVTFEEEDLQPEVALTDISEQAGESIVQFEEPEPPAEEAAPFVEEAAPFVEVAAPFVEEAAPFVEAAAPFVEAAAPFVEAAAPFVEAAAPFVEEAAPFVEEAAPFVEEAAPFVEEAAPFVEKNSADEILELGEDDILELDDEAIVEEVAEETIDFASDELELEEETAAGLVDFSAPEPMLEPEPVGEAASPDKLPDEVEASPEPPFEPAPVFEPSIEPQVETVSEAVAVADVAAVEEQMSKLNESDLEEVVKKLAGPIIEKLAAQMLERVVWEVVPDLAESMIKDEIRKIKEGAA